MSLVRQWNYLFGAGFSGGPDFESCNTYALDFDGITFEAILPHDNLMVGDMSQKLNFPFRSQGWFDRHSKQLWNHFYVPTLTHNWVYQGPFWKVLNEPFGTLSFGVWLKRVASGQVLSLTDLSLLERAVHADYEDFFEAKPPGRYGRGLNTEVRERAEQMFGPKSYPTSRNLIAEKDHYLRQNLQEIPERFGRRIFGEREWVYYCLDREPHLPVHHYCFPLDERHYIDAHVYYGVDFRQYFHLWKSHAEAAEQRIMSSVRLTFPT